VGADDGTLWYTRDGGVNWGASAFSGSGTGHVLALAFSNTMVGYMAHQTAAPIGRIFRTVDGGAAWYALPEAPGLTLVVNREDRRARGLHRGTEPGLRRRARQRRH
jgi:photosystem II stability/assembly factor-like uncharacterized protein